MKTVTSSDAKQFVQEVLEHLSVPAEDAAVTASALVKAHLRGVDTHGIPCLPGYVECLVEGRITTDPEIQVERRLPCSAILGADNGLGPVAATRGMKLALEMADEFGIGVVGIRRSNHFGAAGVYTMMALEHDCIGIVTANASPVVAPFGAAENLLGTNPFSVAIPAGSHPPFVLDMATAEGSRKKIRRALTEGAQIPNGWALDKQGLPTTDPVKALEGVMLPFGGVKGSAITLLMDILSGVLPGAEFGGRVGSVFSNQERESGNGNFMLALKVNALAEVDTFRARMDEELDRLKALKPAHGFDEVGYPGERAAKIQAYRQANGIPLDRLNTDSLNVMCESIGLMMSLPSVLSS